MKYFFKNTVKKICIRFWLLASIVALSYYNTNAKQPSKNIILGVEQLDVYLPLIQGKKVGLLINHTSVIKNTHLIDTLHSLNIDIRYIFAPEHGFRGNLKEGEKFENSIDPKTNIPIISLYGKNQKPSQKHLQNIDVVIFDIQDVGARFYTYISSLYLMMQALAEANKELLVLDRPNPNGDYVDGPVLNMKFQSFVGMLPIPIIHGLTVAELARMINGEGWLEGKKKCKFQAIKCLNYTHNTKYSPSIKPSPNLPNYTAIRLYPSLCFFEATQFSIGRGTPHPFQIIGYPNKSMGNFTFNVEDKTDKHYGEDLRNEINSKFTLKYIISYYYKFANKEKFFTSPSFMDKLAGTDLLRKQIIAGYTEEQIRATWQEDLKIYKKLREKYLLYE